jgi:hypothetical protein
MGHEDQFRPSSLSGGDCRLGKETFVGMVGKEEDAPKGVTGKASCIRCAEPE